MFIVFYTLFELLAIWDTSNCTFFFFFFRMLNIFNTHMRSEGKCFLKKLTIVYIQKGLNLEYTI